MRAVQFVRKCKKDDIRDIRVEHFDPRDRKQHEAVIKFKVPNDRSW